MADALSTAVAELREANPGMGVKKLCGLVKKHSPELASVGAKQIRQAIADLEAAKAGGDGEAAAQSAAAADVLTAVSAPKAAAKKPEPEPEPAPAPEPDPEPVDEDPVSEDADEEKIAPLANRPPTGPRPRSALKTRGTNGNGETGKGKGIEFRSEEELVMEFDIPDTGNMNPTPPRMRGNAQRAQQSEPLSRSQPSNFPGERFPLFFAPSMSHHILSRPRHSCFFTPRFWGHF